MGSYNSIVLNKLSEGVHSKQNLTQEKYIKTTRWDTAVAV